VLSQWSTAVYTRRHSDHATYKEIVETLDRLAIVAKPLDRQLAGRLKTAYEAWDADKTEPLEKAMQAAHKELDDHLRKFLRSRRLWPRKIDPLTAPTTPRDHLQKPR
jgi:hypothetical protein